MTRSLSLLLVVCAACSTLDPIPRGVCGNGLIEPGEDCDSNDPTCVACAVTCTTAMDCPNAGYACGVDGVCHAPSGVFAPATPQSLFLVDDIRITDVDHDSIGDVVGVSKTTLAVRFGDKQGTLAKTFATQTPPQNGPAAFGLLDSDATLDAALVTPDGVVAYASPFGTPTPLTSLLPLALPGFNVRAFVPLSGLAVGAVMEDNATHTMVLGVIEFTTAGTTFQIASQCGISTADFNTDGIDFYRASADSDATVDAVLSMWTKTSGHHLCATAIHLGIEDAVTHVRTITVVDITPVTAAPSRKPIWADLDIGTEACPSLIDSDGGAKAMKAWVGATTAGHCGIANVLTAIPTIPNADLNAQAIGHIPMRPQIPFFGRDVLVMANSMDVFILGQASFTEVYHTERTLSHVTSGDLDGDGRIDAVLSAKDDDDLEVVFRANNSVFPGYIILRYDTAGVVVTTWIDDFDGDGVDDIAFVEQLLDHEELSIAYGDASHTLVTVPTAQFTNVQSLLPMQVPDSSDPFGAIADLLVFDDLGPLGVGATLLHGTPQRAMLAYFEPRAATDPNRPSPLREVVIGDFASTAGTTQYRDVLALLADSAPTSLAGVTAYRLDGTALGLDPNDPFNVNMITNTPGGEHIDGLEDCTVGAGTLGGSPCIRNAQLIAWTTAANHDILIGVDRQPKPRAFVIDPWAFTTGGTMAVTPADMFTATVPTSAVVHSSRAIDRDGDGLPDVLVLAFAPAQNKLANGPGLVEICTLRPNGTPQTCTDLLPIVQQVAPTMTACVDAAPGHFTAIDPLSPPPTTSQLMVLCHASDGQTTFTRVDWDGTTYTPTLIASKVGELRQIEIGDINGDQIDDIVGIRGDAQARTLSAYIQCTSRDVTCQRTGLAP